MDKREQDPATKVGASLLCDIMDVLPGTFYVINEAGHFVLWNTQVELATGRDATQLRTTHMLELFPPADRPVVAQAFCDVFEQDGMVQVEAHLEADGRQVPYLLCGTRLVSGDQKYVLGCGIDLSSHYQQKDTLELRERALHAVNNGVVITRCDGADNPIVYVNPAFERITGYTLQEALGRDSRFMAAPGHDAATRAQLAAAVAARRPLNVVLRNRRKNGELFWNHLSITPVRDRQHTVSHYVGIIEDVTEQRQRMAQLEHQVTHDALTGLANRTLLRDRIEHAVTSARRTGLSAAVILLDLNRFKEINDTLGHDAGDFVLCTVARRLQEAVRDSDTVARLGGDEFVLVLPDQPDLRFTLGMICRIRQALMAPLDFNGQPVPTGASMGVAMYPADANNFAALLRAADTAMYESKRGGAGAVHFYSPEMTSASALRLRMEKALRDALLHDEIHLVLQPNVGVADGKLLGLEALLRWRHPELGELLPGEFLSVAESNGLIVELGRRVIDRVCGVLVQLDTLGYPDLPVSVNVSGREFIRHDYLSYLAGRMAQHGIRPARMGLEVKEAQLIRNPDLARKLCAGVRSLGVGLTVDQFGSGISNLHCLRSLSIDQLKMAPESVQEICPHGRHGTLAKTMLDIGHNLNIPVTATSVETQVQRDFLAAHGCPGMQGRYVSEPLAPGELEHWLAGRALH
ncbi:EAL domain-containing protein [Duganella sp. FT92W]|uniref:EAL domain-containing protein n=1 Tax=Pseudoduganella rivuli TaxID=2666085 RepID=A0A7X2IRT1_9BURK|nr:EAL domain-containing protein [Pseudoduganella rivuli]